MCVTTHNVFNKHRQEEKKMKRIVTIILSVLLGLLFFGSGIMKLIGSAEVQAQFAKWGLGSWMRIIGVIEILCAALFLIPRTMVLGTLLLSAYLGGAMLTHITHAEPPFAPAIVLAVVWITAYLKKPTLFDN